MSDYATSEDARKDGNKFFLEREFLKAIHAYQKALDLDPADWRPSWNLSAVYFELGNYSKVFTTTTEILNGAHNLQEPDRQKVLQRLMKALLLGKRYSQAKKGIAELAEGPEKSAYGRVVDRWNIDQPTGAKSRGALNHVRELPYTKPHMDDVAEFYTVGHDTPGSMYDALLFFDADESDTLAFFYAGIGDARHAFQTIIAINRLENMEDLEVKKMNFHFTLNDVKHEVLARDLILFLLLERLSSELPAGTDFKDHRMVPERAKKTLLTLAYIYIAAIVPPEVYDDLQAVLAHAISSLLGNTALPAWIDIRAEDANAIVPILKDWQNNVTQAFPTAKFIANATKGAPMEDSQAFDGGYCWENAEPMKEELRQFRDCALIIPPKHAIHADLQTILQAPKSRTRTSQLRSYLSSTWKGNTTLVDLKWIEQADAFQKDHYFDVSHNPFEFAQAVSGASLATEPKEPEHLYDWTAQFFLDIAVSLAAIRDRMRVEFLQGDVVRVLEDFRCGTSHGRDASYPVKYDRIHTSNIPDYIGGSLFHYLFTLPVLKEMTSSFACSNVLRNPPAFKTLESFNNEYALLPDAAAVRQVFRAEVVELERLEGSLYYRPDQNESLSALLAKSGLGAFSVGDYYGWQLTKQLAPKDLRNRTTTEKWLHGFFMKLCYPPMRPVWQAPTLVAYPLNLTIFFRILATLHGNRYPAHWLADVLSDIVNNRAQSIARPPRSYPYAIAECKKNFGKAWVNLAPFMAEMRTLTAMWLPGLPFGLTDASKIPLLSKVRRYTVTFEHFLWQGLTNHAVFNLLFANAGLIGPIFPTGDDGHMRNFLLTDEKRDRDTGAERFRKNCAVISTWTWSMKENKGTFWMDEDVVEKWLEEGWQATILRQDNWVMCAEPVHLNEVMRKEEYWVQRT